ncbi:MAG: tetratricopeptide repeat protein [Flavobacteriales bacterium]|nr:tetratricopeptide repeat protein [Flavobacteriales bacterium]
MKYFLILLLVFAFAGTQAQTNLDSLYAVWQDEAQPDSNRVDAFFTYIWEGILFSNPDSAFTLAEELISFGQKKQYPKAKSEAYSIQGVSHAIQGNYPKALNYYMQGLKINEEIGNKEGSAIAIGNIGSIYLSQGNYPKALDYYQRSLKIKEKIGDRRATANAIGNIGSVYGNQENYIKALEYFHRSLKIYEEFGNKKGIAATLNNIGSMYQSQEDYPKAPDYYQRSLKIKEEIGDIHATTNALLNIGVIYKNQGDYPKAIDYYQRSLKISQEIGDKKGSAGSMYNIGLVYQDQGDYHKALSYCKESLVISKDVGALVTEKDACQCLYETYKAMGNGNEALVYHEQLTVLNDSLFNEENTKKLTQLAMQYDFDKKEAVTLAEQEKKDAIALQELKRQKLVRNGFMGGFAVVLLFAGVFFIQRNRIGKEKERSEELLLNILPTEVAEELKNKGHSDAQLIDQVTVLFTDFKGFTAMSEQLTPKELVQDLHECFSEFDRICEKYGIEKIKTIGDAYMAAGGLPSPNSTHPQDVVKAALEMAQVVEQDKAKKIANNQLFFEMRVGIHTGSVVAGIVGVKKFAYDIWGDTVNTASRMESSGEVGKVNISQATYTLLKDDAAFSFTSRGKVEAKGKGEMEMYFVSQKV